jgi:hypothetical protein
MKFNQSLVNTATFARNSLLCKRLQVPEIGVSHARLPAASRAGDYSPSMSGALIVARFCACGRLR